jgi:hypothetical protein
MAAAKIWNGAEALRRQLVPIDSVHPHPGNPRRGAVEEIVESLTEFGQTKPLLLDPDGTIIAGHHILKAARELGWTHVAAIPNDFGSAAEASAYLLADNRLSDLGEYERAVLVEMLSEVEKAGAWKGTGYQPDDLAHMRALEERAAAPAAEPPPVAPGVSEPPPALREIVLLYDEEQLSVVAGNIRTLRARYKLDDVTETVVEAVRREAVRLNQGDGS